MSIQFNVSSVYAELSLRLSNYLPRSTCSHACTPVYPSSPPLS
jgi:hypothetical protein